MEANSRKCVFFGNPKEIVRILFRYIHKRLPGPGEVSCPPHTLEVLTAKGEPLLLTALHASDQQHFAGAEVVVFVYSIVDSDSFLEVPKWKEMVKGLFTKKMQPVRLLVGSSLAQRGKNPKCVSMEEGVKLSQKLNCERFIECDPDMDLFVEEIFDVAANSGRGVARKLPSPKNFTIRIPASRPSGPLTDRPKGTERDSPAPPKSPVPTSPLQGSAPAKSKSSKKPSGSGESRRKGSVRDMLGSPKKWRKSMNTESFNRSMELQKEEMCKPIENVVGNVDLGPSEDKVEKQDNQVDQSLKPQREIVTSNVMDNEVTQQDTRVVIREKRSIEKAIPALRTKTARMFTVVEPFKVIAIRNFRAQEGSSKCSLTKGDIHTIICLDHLCSWCLSLEKDLWLPSKFVKKMEVEEQNKIELEYHSKDSLTFMGFLNVNEKPPVSCEDCVEGLYEPQKVLKQIKKDCLFWYETQHQGESKHPNPKNLTQDEFLAVGFYTWDIGFSGSRENNLFYHLNQSLRKRDPTTIKKWSGYLYYLQSALNKFPNIECLVYRGIPDKDVVIKNYTFLRRITWSSYSSTTTSLKKAQEFAGPQGVIMKIKVTHGKDICEYSAFQQENEVLLSPNFKLTVTRTIYQEDGNLFVDLSQDPTDEEFIF